eukprot:11629004-Alexandrium_andersonii.AAC.1
MAAHIESSPVWGAASTDPLDIPVNKGPQRSRAIDPALKLEVATLAAKGHFGKSGRAVCKSLQRFAWKRKHGCAAVSANRWMDKGLQSAAACAQHAFRAHKG